MNDDGGSASRPVLEHDFAEACRRDYWANDPPPRHYAAPQTLPGDTIKNWMWLAARPDEDGVTGSSSAAKVALHSYPPSFPHEMWLIATGAMQNDFKGNKACTYGDNTEGRQRGIVRAALHVTVTEYGLFSSRVYKSVGVSPDGITRESLVFEGFIVRANDIADALAHGGQRYATRQVVRYVVGPIAVECKASPDHQYLAPLVYHIVQTHLQMDVLQLTATALTVFSRDIVRIFLVLYCRAFYAWMRRRFLLWQEHVRRRVPIGSNNPYFRYDVPREQGDRTFWPNTLAEELKKRWFPADTEKQYGPIRPPLKYQDWLDELALLGMTAEQWDATPRYAEAAPRPDAKAPDAAQMCAPPKPQIFQIYHHRRVQPASEVDLMQDPEWVKPVDELDAAFFAANFPSAEQYAERKLAGRKFHSTRQVHPRDVKRSQAPRTIDRMFITRVSQAPQYERPEPADETWLFETAQEAAAFERRMISEKAKYDKIKRDMAEAGCAKASALASKERREGPRKRQTTLAFSLFTNPADQQHNQLRAAAEPRQTTLPFSMLERNPREEALIQLRAERRRQGQRFPPVPPGCLDIYPPCSHCKTRVVDGQTVAATQCVRCGECFCDACVVAHGKLEHDSLDDEMQYTCALCTAKATPGAVAPRTKSARPRDEDQ